MEGKHLKGMEKEIIRNNMQKEWGKIDNKEENSLIEWRKIDNKEDE